MGLKHHTIILVPHSRAKFRKWRISNRQVRLIGALVAVLTLTVGYLTWTHFTTTIDLDELAQLRTENSELRRMNDEFESSLRTLQSQLTRFEDQTNNLAIVAGLGDVVDSVSTRNAAGAGAGGDLSVAPDAPTNLRLLDDRTSELGQKLERVGQLLSERTIWISAQPSITPVEGIFTSFFGVRTDPLTRRKAFHQGLDISAAPKTPVRAAADGVVVRAGRVGTLGRAVYISHGYGITTRYGHLASVEVVPGQEVRQNDLVGTVGNSGRSTGFHLHYEVRANNRAKNPLEYILDR